MLCQHHGHSRALTEGAAVTCVKLCKSSTYVNISDRANVLFVLVHTVNQDLKVCASFIYFCALFIYFCASFIYFCALFIYFFSVFIVKLVLDISNSLPRAKLLMRKEW